MSKSRLNARPAPAAGILVFLTVLVFMNCVSGEFVWDDEQFVQKNAYMTSWKHLPALLRENVVAGAGLQSNLYRPVQSLTHFLDTRLWGSNPRGHHLTNLLLHAALAAAVFHLFLALAPALPAFLAACFFALHPIQSEAVAYISGRGDTLAMLFLVLSLLNFDRRRTLSLLLAALAMLSKESMALLPVFLWLFELSRGRKVQWRSLAPYAALSAAYVLLRLTVFNFANTLNFYNEANVFTENFHYRLYTYFTTLLKGLLLWAYPVDLHHERFWPVFSSFRHPIALISFLVWALLIGGAFLFRKKAHLAWIGLLWFLAATIPTSNLFVLINAIFYDHWFILPGLGLALALTGALSFLLSAGKQTRLVTKAVCAALIGLLAFSAYEYNRVWKTPVSLYTHILAWEPRSAKIHGNLGMAYAEEGENEKAVEFYEKSIALSDEFPQTHHNLGNAYEKMGETDKALEEYRKALAMDPSFYHSHLQMGLLYLKRDELEPAERAFAEARQIYPYAPNIYLGLAQIAYLRGDKAAALALLEEGLRVLPGEPAILNALQKINA